MSGLTLNGTTRPLSPADNPGFGLQPPNVNVTAPLTILINKASFSAAEKLAAEIEDNRAGVILGDRSAGAGCGHAMEDSPLNLPYSKGTLSLPD
ncbi:S41 family peptidase [Acetobacter sp. DsW_063]|uniref:S41 family peptidase n=1 Tax=Acetobacter sp. DsW_063 TaxID=1514894 RepID=UPI0035166EBB